MRYTFLMVGNESDGRWSRTIKSVLAPLGVLTVTSVEKFKGDSCDRHGGFDVVFLDASTIEGDIKDLIIHFREMHSDVRVVVVAASPTWRRARTALLAGASDYVPKSHDESVMEMELRSVLEDLTRTRQHDHTMVASK